MSSQITELYNSIKKEYDFTKDHIRNKLEGYSCSKYYFNEQSKINSWNKKTGIIEFSILNVNMRLFDGYKEKLDKVFIDNVVPASRYLPEILKKGWQWNFISKKEYNLLALLADFSKKMEKIINSLEIDIKNFLLLEDSFFKLTYYDEYPKIIINAFRKIFGYQQGEHFKNEENIQNILNKLEIFFTDGMLTPSFYDLIIGYNIVYFKRYFNWKDLFKNNLKTIIPSGFYFCSKEVFTDIVNFLRTTFNELDRLGNEKRRLEKIKSLAEFKQDSDPQKIVEFYLQTGNNWNKDKNNTFALLINLVGGVINKVDKIVNYRWEMVTDTHDTIDDYIIKDNNLTGYYEKISSQYEGAKNRYSVVMLDEIKLKDFLDEDQISKFLENPNIKFIYFKIMDILGYLMEISIIFNHYYELKDVDGYSHLHYLIVKPEEWCGKPVNGILLMLSELFLQICSFFKITRLYSEINKLSSIKKKIKALKIKLKEISDDSNYIIDYLKNENSDIDDVIPELDNLETLD